MVETIKTWLTGNWFSILVLVYLIGMMLYGHKRGFLRLAVSVFALVITLLAVKTALPHVTSFLKTHTGIEAGIRTALLKGAGIDKIDDQFTLTAGEQQQAIAALKLPDNLKKLLEANNNGTIWDVLGVHKFSEYLGDYLTGIIMNYLCFGILFLIVWILLHILLHILDVFTKLPVISGLNQIAGAALGLAEGLAFLWIGFMILSVCSGTVWGGRLLNLITGSRWLSNLYQNNLISFFLKDLINAMF